MEIRRKIFCNGYYEGVYQLIQDGNYMWRYIEGTTGEQIDSDQFDYPISNIESGRDSPRKNRITPYHLQTLFYFKEEDLGE